MRQYGLMLLIVIQDEKTKIEEPGEKTAHELGGDIQVPECARQGAGQKTGSGNQMRPTPRRGVRRVRFSRQYYLFSRSHSGSNCLGIDLDLIS